MGEHTESLKWIFATAIKIEKNWDKQHIFHAFLFNIKNYSPEVINIQRREAELNSIVLRVNNFDIKQKKAWNICFMPPKPHKIWEDKGEQNTANFSHNTSFFCKNSTTTYSTTTPFILFHFILLLYYSFCITHFMLFHWYLFLKLRTHEKINKIRIFLTWNRQLIRDWHEIKKENTIHIHDVIIIDVTGVQ